MSSKKFLLGQAVITRLDDKLNGEKRCTPSLYFLFPFFLLSLLLLFFLCFRLSFDSLGRLSLYIYIFFFPSSFPICISRLLALQSNITPFFSIIRKLSTCHGQANEGFRYRREPRNFLTLKKISWKYIAQKLLLYAQKDKRFGKKRRKSYYARAR